MIRLTRCPNACRARGKAPATSASPPVLAKGTASEERRKLYSEAQRIIVADLPMPPLFFSVEYAAIRDNVQGFEWIPDQIPRFRDLWKTAR